MKILKRIYLIFMAFGLLLGCSREDNPGELRSDIPLQLFPTKGTKALVSPSLWANGDQFGLFMRNTGSTGFSNLLENNRQFSYNGSNFVLSDALNAIFYPMQGAVDVIAYAPFKNAQSTLYNIDVSSQSDLRAIDFLYSNNAVNLSKNGNPVNLEFDHKLCQLNFTLSQGTGMQGVDLATTQISFKGMPVSSSFDLSTGSFTGNGQIADINLGDKRKAIIIPQTAASGRKISFSINGQTWEYQIPDTETFESGKQYNYLVTINSISVTVSGLSIQPWVENNPMTGSISLDNFVYCPPGTFLMGDTLDIVNSILYETPRHWVKLTRGFYIGKYEITNGQYVEFLNDVGAIASGSDVHNPINTAELWFQMNPTYNKISVSGNQFVVDAGFKNKPVTCVTWYGAMAYAKWAGGILPTEAQWEYAARAGTNTRQFFEGTGLMLGDVAWYSGNSVNQPHEVGTKKPNPWGLYDIYGNAWEWCLDSPTNYPMAPDQSDPIIDPNNFPNVAIASILRGGEFQFSTSFNNSIIRGYSNKSNVVVSNGFRLVFQP